MRRKKRGFGGGADEESVPGKKTSAGKDVLRYDENGRPVFKRKIKEENILTKRTRADKAIFGVVFILFVLYTATLVFAVGWMFMTSLKPSSDDFGFGLPSKWLFSNYADAFTMLNAGDGTTNFFGMIFNSLWYTVMVTSLGVIMPCITGYVMSKYDFPGRNIVFAVAITSMMIPIVGNTASNMKLAGEIGIYDTPFYPLLTSLGGFGGNFLIYYGFFKSVSWSYAEAAQIDGADPFTVFFRVMLPHAVPIMLTYAITNAIFNWNEYQSILLYMPSYPTLASGLFDYKAQADRLGNIPIYFAGLIISMLPTIALFAAFSNKVMTSLSIGGLKG